MSDRETLLSTLPESLHDDAAKLYETSEDLDPHDVIAELHRRGLLDAEGVRTAVLELQASLRVGRMRSRPPPEQEPSILGPLGAGAMGEVLLAKDEGLGRVVAIKRLLPAIAGRPAIVERFYREAQITAQLDHPSIVPIHSLNTEGGSLSYTMKLVRGRTFEHYLDDARACWKEHGTERGEYKLSERLERFLHVLDAIAYAHEKGVVHRDLKPENIMVGTFGQVQVMDWGIAKVLAKPAEEGEVPTEQQAPQSPTKTRAGSVFGTPRYMSPEQALGKNDTVDGRSDQYALGLILFELVTLKPAVTGVDVESCLTWAREAKKQPMTHFARKGHVPRELVAIVEKATQKEPDKRYASVSAMGEDLRRYLRDESILAKPDTPPQRLVRWVGHHRSTVVALVMLLVLLFATSLLTLGSGAIVTIEWRRRVAAAHEDTVAALIGTAQEEASKIDAVLRSTEQSLVGLAYSVASVADRAGKGPPAELKVDPFAPGPAPRARRSQLYGRAVAVDALSLRGARSEEGDTEIQHIFSTPYAFSQVLLDAAGQQTALTRKELLALVESDKVPVRWVKLATSKGLLATLPGTETKFGSPNVRDLPWYRKDPENTITWLGPGKDPEGMGLLLTATRPVVDHKNALIGTVAVDLGAHALVERMKPPAGFDSVWLVNKDGQIVLWSGMATDGSEASKALPDAALLPQMEVNPSSFYERGEAAAAWATVGALDWKLVLWSDGGNWRRVTTRRPERY